jgi:hypothetical protein
MISDELSATIHRKPLGRVLVEMGALDDEQLEHVLACQRQDGRRLGDILVDRGFITPLALVSALAQQKAADRARRRADNARSASWKPLGEILVGRGCIGRIQLQQALADQRLHGGLLGETLVARGWVTPAELVAALGVQLASGADVESCFEVREQVGDDVRTLHVAPTFIAATDYVFDEVLIVREPQLLEIVRGTGAAEEVVWRISARPKQEPSVADLVGIFSMLCSQTTAAEAAQ